MSHSPIQMLPADQANPDDEIAALTLQLDEIHCHDENQKGKYPVNNPPDIELAFSSFETEIQAHLHFLVDLKLAQSIAHAVDTDSQAITDLAGEEAQAQQDRNLALRINGDDPQPEAPPPYTQLDVNPASSEERPGLNTSVFRENYVSSWTDQGHDAGPSTACAGRREGRLVTPPQTEAQCCVCFDDSQIIRLQCGDVFCNDCLKSHFLRATKDEALFPPRCCREQIHLALIATWMSADELEAFNSAELEFSTNDRTYCSNLDCGRFIPPERISAGKADCGRCRSATCAMCKGVYHTDDCPEDTDLQATLALATSQGWQRCFACRAVVELNIGCYHMTCKCGAQFCYVCGIKWKGCFCERWDEENLGLRAEEVVDREAVHPLGRPERQRRVVQMREELLDSHECEHRGRFERIFGGGRRGFECEMCGDRHWKYALQCRHCHMRICEDCRRHRVR